MRIVFMGTPDFALPSLQRLIADGHEIAAVFCQPDKPQGRHQILTAPPVKQAALNHNIPVYQPESFKEADSQELLTGLAPDLIVVAAYGKLLPPSVLTTPKHGCINVHGSLLPKYRGAAPIQRAVINGDKETGVTIMQMAQGLDTGDILFAISTPIGEEETAGELFDRLAVLGAKALSDAIARLDSLVAVPQDDSLASWASPLKKQDGLLDFSLPAHAVYARLRGVTPWPGGWVQSFERKLKFHEALLSDRCGGVGELLDSKRLIIGCGQGSIEILELSPEGSRKMNGASFINGRRLKPGDPLF